MTALVCRQKAVCIAAEVKIGLKCGFLRQTFVSTASYSIYVNGQHVEV